MSIYSINVTNLITPFNFQQNLDCDLEQAVKQLDFSNIKLFIQKRANPNLKVEIDFTLYAKINSMAMLNEREYFIEKITKAIDSQQFDKFSNELHLEILNLLKLHFESEYDRNLHRKEF